MSSASVDELRQRARRRLPRMFFDYIDGGSFSETTLRANRHDFDAWSIQPAVMRDVSHRDLSADILGARHALPLVLGPVGFAGLFAARGEVQAARAAAVAGVPMCLSTFSICPLGEVAAAMGEPPYFQLYVFRDRGLADVMMDAARAAGVRVLVLTVDSGVSGIRERDTRNGFRTAKRLGLRAALDMAAHPRWLLDRLRSPWPALGNMPPGAMRSSRFMDQVAFLSGQVDPSLTWNDVAWIRAHWEGSVVVKGVLTTSDARLAVQHGADAVVVSNHGGRQLDCAPSSVSVLPEIAEALEGRAGVLFDGGVRRGTDVIKALALGADAVFLGRAFAFGLAAGGAAGVAQALSLIRAELDITLGLMGLDGVAALKAAGTGCLRRRWREAGTAARDTSALVHP